MSERPWSSRRVERWSPGGATDGIDQVAEEVPVALVYNGISHAVMLASPADLEDFALGFSLSEGILRDASDLYDLEVEAFAEGIQVDMRISAECFMRLKQRRRNLTGRTGCGLCGVETLEQAVRHPAPVAGGLQVSAETVHRAMAAMTQAQPLQRITGAVHAAAWARPDGSLQLVREDVGRHNALDKLLGAMAADGTDHAAGFIVITSRASYEIVQKAATRGVALVAAISAPTGLAVRIAEEAGVTLLGFTRGGGHVAYAHPERLAPTNSGTPE
ncbi:MAG: formate dehydrogenase accessory sulfurtransferase FdhD [Zoogloeaceae bacterium]|nr:formate dehydrogenase accessory sulfurtransferase FdhD [Zoogloeaceae bacterium]